MPYMTLNKATPLLRYLGNAWSIVFSLLFVLTIALLVISRGRLGIICYQLKASAATSATASDEGLHISMLPRTFDMVPSLGKVVLRIPLWFAALMFALLAAIPCVPWASRFSLRTLLIVTTLVAVGLGWITWAIRK